MPASPQPNVQLIAQGKNPATPSSAKPSAPRNIEAERVVVFRFILIPQGQPAGDDGIHGIVIIGKDNV